MRKVQKTTIQLNDDPNDPIDGDELTVMGFGKTSEDGNPSPILLHTQVDYVAPDICDGLMVDQNISEDTMLCAYRENSDRLVFSVQLNFYARRSEYCLWLWYVERDVPHVLVASQQLPG